MAYKKRIKKFGRKRDVRKALMRSLARSLILNGQIKTTEAKAKALRPLVESIITKGRNSDLATRRKMLAFFCNDKHVVAKVIEELSPKYENRSGGYTRIIKIFSPDSKRLAIIEFV